MQFMGFITTCDVAHRFCGAYYTDKNAVCNTDSKIFCLFTIFVTLPSHRSAPMPTQAGITSPQTQMDSGQHMDILTI